MSAINVMRRQDAVYLMTDGGGWDREHVLDVALLKVWPMPHIRATVAGAAIGIGGSISVIGTIGDRSASIYDERELIAL